MIRNDWTIEELRELHDMPLIKLIAKAMNIHQQFHNLGEIQVCKLISVKTGGCSEDCKYCTQSSRYKTNVRALPMMKYEEVFEEAKRAISRGATRICLGTAWRGVRNSKQFNEILKMVKAIADLGAEVCCTLGLLNEREAKKLKEAGLYAYNHNLDSSEKFYKTIISTRTYQDRLNTLDVVEKTGISVCCGGIIGMGETEEDRLELLHTLCNRDPHPESVPINKLVPIKGTPLENKSPLPFWELLKMIAIARVVMPKSMVRLSAGRIEMSLQSQALCFLAGANSIFAGDKLLTVANTKESSDKNMFELLGLTKRPAYANETST